MKQMLEKLFFWKKKKNGYPVPDGPYFSDWVTFGGESVFIHKEKGIHRVIVDKDRMICSFPGIDPDVPKAYADTPPRVRYRTSFEKHGDGKYLMIWTVEPDGRYWADEDGFGMTNDEEVCLYTLLDDTGAFLHPFRLYSIGSREFYPWKDENKAENGE